MLDGVDIELLLARGNPNVGVGQDTYQQEQSCPTLGRCFL
jgi:hypothetical protein